jgi:hypothetical protein
MDEKSETVVSRSCAVGGSFLLRLDRAGEMALEEVTAGDVIAGLCEKMCGKGMEGRKYKKSSSGGRRYLK